MHNESRDISSCRSLVDCSVNCDSMYRGDKGRDVCTLGSRGVHCMQGDEEQVKLVMFIFSSVCMLKAELIKAQLIKAQVLMYNFLVAKHWCVR